MMQLRQLVRKWAGQALTYSPASWLFVALPLALSVAILLSIGPSLQHYAISLLSSDQPTIYGSAHAESLVTFPTVWEWLGFATHPLFISIAVLATAIALRTNRFTSLIVSLSLSIFILLCLADIGGTLVLGTFSLSAQATDVGANLVGTLILGMIVATLLWLFETIATWQRPASIITLAPAATGLITASLLLSLICYYGLHYFYQPMPVEVTITAKPTIQGAYGTRQSPNAKADLDLLGKEISGGLAEVTSAAGQMEVRWDKRGTPLVYDARIELYTDCINPNPSNLPTAFTALERTNISTLSAHFDGGPSFVSLQNDRAAHFTFKDTPPQIFWIKDNKTGPEVQYFTTKQSSLRQSNIEVFDYYIGAMLARPNGKISQHADRTITIISDGIPTQIHLRKPTRFNPNHMLHCAAADIGKAAGRFQSAGSDQAPRISKDIFAAGIRVRIRPRSELRNDIYPRPMTLDIRRMQGWAAVRKLDRQAFQNRNVGTAELLTIDQGLDGLTVDDAKLEISEDVQITAFGEFNAAITTDGRLKISGTARTIWKDRKRLNPTKWERLPLELHIFVLTSLLGFIYGLAKIASPVASRLKTNSQLVGL